MEAITITGNIGKDAELKTTGKGDAFATFSVACQKKKDAPTTWYRVAVFGKRGEALCQYLTKGSKVTVIGDFEVREYQKDGQTKTSLEIRTYDVALQGGGERGGSSSGDGFKQGRSAGDRGEAGDGGFGDDADVPFLSTRLTIPPGARPRASRSADETHEERPMTTTKTEQPIALWWQFNDDDTDMQHKLPTGCRLNMVKHEIVEFVTEDVSIDGEFSSFAHGGGVTIGLEDGTTVSGHLDVEVDPRVEFWILRTKPIATESATTAAGAE